MFCTKCGKEFDNVKFCPACGNVVEIQESPMTITKYADNDDSASHKSKAREKKAKGRKKKLIAILSVVLVIAVLISAFFVIRFFFCNHSEESDQPLREESGETVFFSIKSIIVSECDIQTYNTVSSLVKVDVEENIDSSELLIVNNKNVTIGTVNDNGKNGDECSNDGVYSGMMSFYSEEAVAMNIYVSYEECLSDKYETIYFYPAFERKFYYEYKNLDEELNAIFSQSYDMEQAHTAIMETLQRKKDNGEISDFIFENSSITIKLISGSMYVYSYNPEGAFKAAANVADESSEEVGLYTISPNVNTLISLQPYRDELGPGGVDVAAETVAESEDNFVFSNNSDNSSVDVELIKKLDQYNAILLDGHGGYSSALHSFFGIGTEITEDNNKRYWADLYYDRIIQLSGGQYGVTSAFFERYYDDGVFGDTIVYLGCCHGADDSVLANTLISKGVDAVYAYKNSVTVSYDTKMVTTIFEELSKDQDISVTVENALKKAQSKHGKTDNSYAHWYNWLFGNYEKEENRARLYLFGNKNFTLSMETGSLRGKVADSMTSEFVYNAYITASMPGKTDSAGYTKTDMSGNFNLPLSNGVYNITVRASGYMNCTINNVKVDENSTTYLQNTILLEQRDGEPSAVVSGKITNAVTGNVVEGATVSFREGYNQLNGDFVKDTSGNVLTAVSDASGLYYAENLAYGYYTAEISKDGYATQYINIIASDDADISGNQNFLLAPEAHGNDFRITLEWEENPRDEDAHIVGDLPDDFHVYYSSKSAYHDGDLIANLDHDDTQGNGFETVTMKVDPAGMYSYYVYHYAGTGSLSTSNAIVKVYQGGVMIKQYNVPIDQGSGRYWNVFNIIDGKVVTINRISDSPTQ